MKPSKQPDDHKNCSKCGRPYGFMNCRVTQKDRRNICLKCGVEEERLAAKQHLSPPEK